MNEGSESFGEWNTQKAKLKQKFLELTGNDILSDVGQKDEILQKLQLVLGKTKEELLQLISRL